MSACLAYKNIPIDDIEAVQMLEGDQELGCIEPRSFLVEFPFSLQVMEQFTTVDKGQDEVEFLCALERKLERYDERVVDLGENCPLS